VIKGFISFRRSGSSEFRGFMVLSFVLRFLKLGLGFWYRVAGFGLSFYRLVVLGFRV
jgi:hypothetical protein